MPKILVIIFVPVQVSIQEITTMDRQRISTRNSTRNHGIVLTYRWNRTRNIYELYRHRRGENQVPLLVSEDWDMRLYNRDAPLIFHEQNFNNLRQHYRRENLGRIMIEEGTPDSICSICLEELPIVSEGIQLSSLCCHVYHHDCIMRWLNRSNTCPMCRRPVS